MDNEKNAALIRQELEAGKPLTVLTALQKFKTLELRHYVAKLRKAGMKIASVWTTSESGKRFKIYWLEA